MADSASDRASEPPTKSEVPRVTDTAEQVNTAQDGNEGADSTAPEGTRAQEQKSSEQAAAEEYSKAHAARSGLEAANNDVELISPSPVGDPGIDADAAEDDADTGTTPVGVETSDPADDATDDDTTAEIKTNPEQQDSGQLAEQIANGHAYDKHVEQGGEFPDVENREEFGEVVKDVIDNGAARQLANSRTAHYKDGIIVIHDPASPDGGTAFKTSERYFRGIR